MKFNSILLTTAIAATVMTGCASKGYASDSYLSYDSGRSDTMMVATAETVVKKVNTSMGEVFATASGMTLYTFTKDEPGKSNCDDGCAANWPPFRAAMNADTWGDFTIIQRNDGAYQWAYKNQPLYTWVGDQREGDTNGHGVGNVWYAVQSK